jgi:hypothetical protein
MTTQRYNVATWTYYSDRQKAMGESQRVEFKIFADKNQLGQPRPQQAAAAITDRNRPSW